MGTAIFEIARGWTPPLVKGIGTKRFGKGRVKVDCFSKANRTKIDKDTLKLIKQEPGYSIPNKHCTIPGDASIGCRKRLILFIPSYFGPTLCTRGLVHLPLSY